MDLDEEVAVLKTQQENTPLVMDTNTDKKNNQDDLGKIGVRR